MRRGVLVLVVVCLALFTGVQRAPAIVNVDLELSFMVDVSGSIDGTEFALQQTGYKNAFNDADLYNSYISKGALGKIAVNLIYWAGDTTTRHDQQVAVPWTLIDSVATSQAFATAVGNAVRPFSSNTAPGSAINYAVSNAGGNIFGNDYLGTREVLDISGDGIQNEGFNTATARNNALASIPGIDQINGLPIINASSDPGLLLWYQTNIQGGAGSFTIPANDFAGFENAIKDKIHREIQGVPEPSTLIIWSLLGALGIAIGWWRRG
jgi:hypothetical protein